MTSRFWRRALLSVAVMTALTLSISGRVASEYSSPRHGADSQTVASHTSPVDELAVLLGGVDGRQPASERSSKPRPALFAVAAALLVLPVLRRRRIVVLSQVVRFVLSPSSSLGARAPPAFTF
jgi:hypothetical protein